MTVAVVEGSSTVQVVENAVGAEAATTTGVVLEAEVKTVSDAVEASDQGDGLSGHRVGKEVVVDIPLGPQEGAGVTEPEDEEYTNFVSDFFGPSFIVGSSTLRPRACVPHPKNIPDGGDVFDDARLEEVW